MDAIPISQQQHGDDNNNNSNERMEGWLYLIRSNRIGLQYSRKRYFVLQHHLLQSFKSVPLSKNQVFFIFTVYNTSNHNDQLKGAHSIVGCSKSSCQSFRLNGPSWVDHNKPIDWTHCSSTHTDLVTDVIAPSPWTIFGCQNGKNKVSYMLFEWDDHPAIMAVGVVDGTSEAIFQTLMSLGPSRSKWDFCFYKGSVVEHLDGHMDIIHKELYSDWLPWGMKRRDFLMRRYWRREDDGTYVILYHSVYHKKCPPQKGYVRACLKSGGYVISPVNHGRRSVVKHMLAVDWKSWKSYLRTSSAQSITIRMLGRVAGNLHLMIQSYEYSYFCAFSHVVIWVLSELHLFLLAALRELFKAKLGNCPSSDFSSGELVGNIRLHQTEGDQRIDTETPTDDGMTKKCMNEEVDKTPSEHASLVGLNDPADEFFDVPEPSDYDQLENGWSSDFGPEMYSQDARQPKLSTAAGFVKKLHDLAVQKRGYMDLQEMVREDNISCCYGTTLPKDLTFTLPSSWATADPSSFLIRGKNYLDDQKKFKAKGTLMQMVAADWLRSDKREDDLAGRPGSIVQVKYAAQGGSEFFFIVNIQVPGSTTYSLALYYMMNTPVEDSPLLESFIKGDDAYRNSRFKLIPYISKVGKSSGCCDSVGLEENGSWIVKQSVGKKACLIGQALEMNYFHGKNYLELGVDIGSSTVARGVVSLVLGYLSNLVIEMAFLIQGPSAAVHFTSPLILVVARILRRRWTTPPPRYSESVCICFLKRLYSNAQECPRSYDKLRFDPRKQECRLLATHDDYSMMSKLPREKTSVVTILRNPVDRIFSTYEFSIEVAARFLVHPNLTSATKMVGRLRPGATGVSTLDIWPWKYLVPWMREDLFARRDARKLMGSIDIKRNDPYNMEEMVIPLQEYINDPRAHELIHNGETFQVAGLTNNSYFVESHEVRRCVQKHKILGEHVLEVAKKRLDDMLYVGLTEDHRESATMFANVVGAQVISQALTENSSMEGAGNSKSVTEQGSSHSESEPDNDDHQVSSSELFALGASDTWIAMQTTMQMKLVPQRISKRRKKLTAILTLLPCGDAAANFKGVCLDRSRVSEVVTEQIRSLNHLDLELYKYAQEIFAKQHKHVVEKLSSTDDLESMFNNPDGITMWKFLWLAMCIVFLALVFLFVNARRRMSKVKI
uniref:START domain-containing protein n=1 Tax=Salix viminalis TaxID=40686 RepID=A0A6N2L728_SALVM